jgi:predicted RNA-binding protein with PUA-like domain
VEINKIGLPDLRMNPALEGMPLLMKGSRLSVQPVPEKYFSEICEISGIKNIKDL